MNRCLIQYISELLAKQNVRRRPAGSVDADDADVNGRPQSELLCRQYLEL